jgi:hypothetical protein
MTSENSRKTTYTRVMGEVKLGGLSFAFSAAFDDLFLGKRETEEKLCGRSTMLTFQRSYIRVAQLNLY